MLKQKYKDFIKILPELYFDWIKGLRNVKSELLENKRADCFQHLRVKFVVK